VNRSTPGGESLRVLLFDIDATLLLSGGAGRRALDKTFFELYGVPAAMSDVKPDGKTDPLIIREIFQQKLPALVPEREFQKVAKVYLEYLEVEVETSPGFCLMPGVKELLERLSAIESFALGLATGNLEQGAWIKLRRAGLDGYFRFGGFGSDSEDRTEVIRAAMRRAGVFLGRHVSPTSVYVIGDTPRDIVHARNAGVGAIAVATGRSSVEELMNYAPDHVLEDLSRTEDVIRLLYRA